MQLQDKVVIVTGGASGIGGALSRVLAYAPAPQQPRGFNVTGRHVIVVGERATDAELSRIEDDGTLTSLELVGVGNGANWVRVVD